MSAVKQFIDRNIIDNLDNGFDIARQQLLEKSNKFAKMVDFDINFTEDQIKNINGARERKVSEYVIHARKRIIDLYNIEINYHFNMVPQQKFKLLLFKEKLTCKI